MHNGWRDELNETIEAFLSGNAIQLLSSYEMGQRKRFAREGRVILTDAMRAELIAEQNRTGLGATGILNLIPTQKRLEGLTKGKIDSWVSTNGRSNSSTARADYYDVVMEAYAQQPDLKPMIDLNENQRREKFVAEQKRTGLGATGIFNLIPMQERPKGLTSSMIGNWATDRWTIHTTRADYYDAVMKAYAQQPDIFKLDENQRRKDLIAQQNRTRLGGKEILKRIPPQERPEGLTESIIRSWTNKEKNGQWHIFIARHDHYNMVMKAYEQQSDAFKLDENQRREKFIAEQKRTGLRGIGILNCIPTQERPEGLTAAIIGSWTTKYKNSQWAVRTTCADYYNAVMKAYERQPDANPMVDLNKNQRREKFIVEQNRTGLGGTVIFNLIPPEERPEGLTAAIIGNWANKYQNGQWSIHTTRADYYDVVMKAYEHQPDANPMVDLKKDQRRERLIVEQNRTGLGATVIFNLISPEERPEGLTAAIIGSWAIKKQNGRWNSSTTRADYYDVVMKAYGQQPDANPIVDLKKDQRRERLIEEQNRTGLKAIFNRIRPQEQPEGLTAAIIGNWTRKDQNGQWNSSTARADYYDVVMKAYEQQPDIFKLDEDNRRENLIAEINRTGLKATAIFSQIHPPPDKLTWSLLDNWTTKRNGQWIVFTARADHYNAVIEAYAQQPDAASKPSRHPKGRSEFAP